MKKVFILCIFFAANIYADDWNKKQKIQKTISHAQVEYSKKISPLLTVWACKKNSPEVGPLYYSHYEKFDQVSAPIILEQSLIKHHDVFESLEREFIAQLNVPMN